MLCIEHTFGVDTRGISLVYVLCAKYLKNCSSTNCTKKVQFLHKISLKSKPMLRCTSEDVQHISNMCCTSLIDRPRCAAHLNMCCTSLNR